MNTTGLPNPLDPMAYLPPADALASEFSTYLYMLTSGVSINFGDMYTAYIDVVLQALIWDWVMSMPDEYTILSRGTLSVTKLVYVLSR